MRALDPSAACREDGFGPGHGRQEIREQLAEARLERKEARVDLFIRCHWVAVLFSGWRDDSQDSRQAANELAFSALRLFPVLIERDRSTDRWRVIEKYAEAGKALWSRAIAEKLSAQAIDQALSAILPRTLPIKKHRPVKVGFVLKLMPRLPIADLDAVIARARSCGGRASCRRSRRDGVACDSRLPLFRDPARWGLSRPKDVTVNPVAEFAAGCWSPATQVSTATTW